MLNIQPLYFSRSDALSAFRLILFLDQPLSTTPSDWYISLVEFALYGVIDSCSGPLHLRDPIFFVSESRSLGVLRKHAMGLNAQSLSLLSDESLRQPRHLAGIIQSCV